MSVPETGRTLMSQEPFAEVRSEDAMYDILIGKLPITFLGNKEYLEDVHIYPNVYGTLLFLEGMQSPWCLVIQTPSYYQQYMKLIIYAYG